MQKGGISEERDIEDIWESTPLNTLGRSGTFFVKFKNSLVGSKVSSLAEGLPLDEETRSNFISFKKSNEKELKKGGKLGNIFRIGGIPPETSKEEFLEWILKEENNISKEGVKNIGAIIVRKFPLRSKFFVEFSNVLIASRFRRIKEFTPFLESPLLTEEEKKKNPYLTHFYISSLLEWNLVSKGITPESITSTNNNIYEKEYSFKKGKEREKSKEKEGVRKITLVLRGFLFRETEISIKRWLKKIGILSKEKEGEVLLSRLHRGWVDVTLSEVNAKRLTSLSSSSSNLKLGGRYIEVLPARKPFRSSRG